MKKIICLCVMLSVLSCNSFYVFADGVNTSENHISIEITPQMLEEAKEFERNGKEYIIPIGSVRVPVESEDGRAVVYKETLFSVGLSSNHQGKENMWEVHLNWSGDLLVYSYKAQSCRISSPSALYPYVYFDKPVSVICGLTPTGSASLGVAEIPNEADGVWIDMINPFVSFHKDHVGIAIDFPGQYYPFH